MSETTTITEKPKVTKPKSGITKIRVKGFKSISEEQEIDIYPLTILAGANSSGKSSIMQPLLLLKQTLEVAYDPGALLINGPNVKFTNSGQFLSRCGKEHTSFSIGWSFTEYPIYSPYSTSMTSADVDIIFTQPKKDKKIDVQQVLYHIGDKSIALSQNMNHNDLYELHLKYNNYERIYNEPEIINKISIKKDHFFLDIGYGQIGAPYHLIFGTINSAYQPFEQYIQRVIHLPGLRGNPERTYPVTAVGAMFPGTFDTYTASVIAHWQEQEQSEKLKKLGESLYQLGLTWKVQTRGINETQIELQVGRLPNSTRGGAHDLVNIADVGFGVSQTLPVLVALLEAKPGQMIYLEQPEIHLHPRAQTALAGVLADAARRGVRVVVETHSSLLLLGVQTLVAKGELPPDIVKLHWFSRDEGGSTTITSADLDETGAFGEWPEDFADVELKAQSNYLDAVEARELGGE